MLTFTASRTDLLDSYKVVASTLSSSADGVASNILFRLRAGMVEMLTFNGTTKSMSPVLTESASGSSMFSMEGKRLSLLLNSLGKEETLTVSFDDSTKVVTITDSHGTQRFKTSDITMFPMYDASGDPATEEPVAMVRADALAKAFKIVRNFSDTKSVHKKFGMVNLAGGSLFSTDNKGTCSVTIPGMESVAFNSFSDAAKALSDFLSKFKDQMVNIIVQSSAVYYVLPDGSLFCEEFSPHELAPVVLKGEPIVTYKVARTQLDEVFQWLRAGADWTGGLTATLTNLNGNFRLTCESNTKDSISRVVEAESEGDLSADFSFRLNLDSFHRLFDVFEDTVEFSVKTHANKAGSIYYVSSSSMDSMGNTYQCNVAQERK
jgi:DNA polymerase III sliding clamp (beta) subunit (PCNA family)